MKTLKLTAGIASIALAVLLAGLILFGITNARADGGSCVIKVADVCLADVVKELKGISEPEPVEDDLGAFPGPDIFGPIVIHDGFTEVLKVRGTTTNATAVTLIERDLTASGYTIVTLADIDEGADLTYTFPATSTLSSYVNKVGATERECFFLSATTSDSNLIIAAGTGWDFVYSSTTATALGTASLQWGSGELACVTAVRQPRDPLEGGNVNTIGDITGIVDIYENRD